MELKPAGAAALSTIDLAPTDEATSIFFSEDEPGAGGRLHCDYLIPPPVSGQSMRYHPTAKAHRLLQQPCSHSWHIDPENCSRSMLLPQGGLPSSLKAGVSAAPVAAASPMAHAARGSAPSDAQSWQPSQLLALSGVASISGCAAAAAGAGAAVAGPAAPEAQSFNDVIKCRIERHVEGRASVGCGLVGLCGCGPCVGMLSAFRLGGALCPSPLQAGASGVWQLDFIPCA